MSSSRFSFSELASYLEVPQIATHFALEGSVQEALLDLLRESEVRWGIDAQHKERLELPAISQNTWEHGIDRLLAGYAMGDIDLWQGIAPMSGISGGAATALGRFCSLLEALKQWHLSLKQPRSAQQWQEMLNAMLDTLFGVQRDDDDRLQQIRDAIDDLAQQAGEEVLSIELLQLCLEDSLGTRTQHNRFFSGGVSICGMRPMRSLPFRMICVLGLNDAAFPRTQQSQSFDAMSKHWQAGDPRKGDEDRYLLLETLLCARDKLYLSYTGRSLKDNSELQASVLLREFCDFLNAHYSLEEDGNAQIAKQLSHEYPMQAFSWRQFVGSDEGAQMQSFDPWWHRVADTLQGVSDKTQRLDRWPDNSIGLLEEPFEQIELSRLVRFMQHPVKGFFNTRLGIYLGEDDASDDDENFSLGGLQTWQMHKSLISSFLQDEQMQSEELMQVYSAQGVLPHGAMAQQAYSAMRSQAEGLLERLQDFEGLANETIALQIACPLPNTDKIVTISGQLQSYYPGRGLLHYTPSSIKPKYILALWLEHLAFCAVHPQAATLKSVLLCKDDEIEFMGVSADDAIFQLGEYLSLYVEGLTRPLPLFPLASYELALGDDEGAISKARKKWQKSEYSFSADEDDPYIDLVNRHCSKDPIEEPGHIDLAQRVYGPARQALEAQ